jgi:hypothetical protein
MARYILMLRMDILHSTDLLLKCNSLPLICSGTTAALRGVLLTFGKMKCSASLDGYGLMAIPAEVPVAPLEDLVPLFLLSSDTL